MATYRIPQKATPEDKLIGPFTIRDLVFLLITGVICYLIFTFLPQNPLVIFSLEEILFIIAISALLGCIFIFIKPEERGLELWLVDFLHFLNSAKVRMWRKEIHPIVTTIVDSESTKNTEKSKTPVQTKEASVDRKKIDTLSTLIDNPEQALLDKQSADLLNFLEDEEEIEKTKKLIQTEQQELATTKKQKKRSQEILKFIKPGDVIGPGQPYTPKQSEVLAKPASGLAGLFSSISRGLSALFTTPSSTATEIELDKKTSTPSEQEKKQIPLEKTVDKTSTDESTSPLNGSTSPENLLKELQELKKENTKTPKKSASAPTQPKEQTKPVKIISESDPMP